MREKKARGEERSVGRGERHGERTVGTEREERGTQEEREKGERHSER